MMDQTHLYQRLVEQQIGLSLSNRRRVRPGDLMVVTPEPYPLPLHVRDVVTALHRPAVHHDRVQIVLCPVLRGRVRRHPVPEPTHPVSVPGPERRRRAVGPHVQDERERHVNVNLTTDDDGVPVPKTALLRESERLLLPAGYGQAVHRRCGRGKEAQRRGRSDA